MNIGSLIKPDEFSSALLAFKTALEKKGILPYLVEGLVDEANTSFSYIQKLATSNLDAIKLEGEIREFLLNRWHFIQDGAAKYFITPYSPINQLCIQLASLVVKEDEPIIRVLIPNAALDKSMIYEKSFIELTEKTDSNGKRQLALHDFIVTDNDWVIPLIPWFKSRAVDNKIEAMYDTKYYMNNTLTLIKESIFPYSSEFIEEVRRRENKTEAPENLADAFRQFIDLIGKNRDLGYGGTNEQAGTIAYYAIRDLFIIWNGLKQEQREPLLQLESDAGGGVTTLDWHLKILESGLNTEVTEEDRGAYENFGTCVEGQCDYIERIIRKNREDFTSINIAPELFDKVKQAYPVISLDELIKQMEKAIGERDMNLKLSLERAEFMPLVFQYNINNIRGAVINSRLSKINYRLNLGLEANGIPTYIDFCEFLEKHPTKTDLLVNSLTSSQFKDYFQRTIRLKLKNLSQTMLKLNKKLATEWLTNCIKDLTKVDFGYIIDLGLENFELTDELMENIFLLAFEYDFTKKDLESLWSKHQMNINRKGASGATLLHTAVTNKLTYVEFLLSKKPDLNIQDDLGATALYVACGHSNHHIVSMLVQAGADLTLKPSGAMSLLDRSLNRSDYSSASILIKVGVELSPDNTYLLYAASYSDYEMAKACVLRKVDINKTNSRGDTPLDLALSNEHVEMTKLLMENGGRFKTDSNYLKDQQHASYLVIPSYSRFKKEQTVAGTSANVLDHIIARNTSKNSFGNFSIAYMRKLLPPPERSVELINMRHLDRLVAVLDLSITYGDTPAQKLVFYTALKACTLEKINFYHRNDPDRSPCVLKAAALREALSNNEPASMFLALRMPETSEGIEEGEVPHSLAKYRNEVESYRTACVIS